MKKLLFISIWVLLSLTISAQKIEYSTVDDFTGKAVIRTDWTGFEAKTPLDVKVGSRKTFDSQFMLRFEEGKVFFHVKWMNSVKTIDRESELLLKLKNGTILSLKSIADFIADTNVYTTQGNGYSMNNIHAVYEGDLSELSDLNLPNKLRVTTVYGSEVYDIDSKNARRLAKAYKLISDEIKKSESK